MQFGKQMSKSSHTSVNRRAQGDGRGGWKVMGFGLPSNFRKFKIKSTIVSNLVTHKLEGEGVVYFDQQTGVLHLVCWLSFCF